MRDRSTHVLCWLGLAAPATAGPRPSGASRRLAPSAPARLATPRPTLLRLLGLAEGPLVVHGHPKIRERAVENLQRRRRRDSVITISIATLLGLLLLGIAVMRSPLLAVDEVAVLGLDEAQQQIVASALTVASGDNVMDVDLAAVRTEVERLPWVSGATVTRRLPSTVEVRVAMHRPVAVATFGEGLYLLTADGLVTEHTTDGGRALSTGLTPDDLPRITVAQPPQVGHVLADPAAVAAASVAGRMPALVDEWVIGYDATPDGEVNATMRVPTPDGPAELVVHIGRPEAIIAKAATIAALVDETIGRGMRPTVLDVRIPDRPVVRT
ncbi:hypothetical protein BH23ACT9_BH23ACT9_37310 [soil metagenome]